MGAVVRTDASPASEEPAGTPATWLFESKNAVAAHSARKQFSEFLRARAVDGSDIAAAELIYGELVSNVVRHAPGPIVVQLDWTSDGSARLSINDTGPVFQYTPSLPDDALCESGRGLYIVACLSKELHIVQGKKGAAVVAVLPVYSA